MKQLGVFCRNCDEPWFALSATGSQARSRSTRPPLVASRRAGVLDDCATVQKRSLSGPLRFVVAAPAECGSASSMICPLRRWSGFSNNQWLPEASCTGSSRTSRRGWPVPITASGSNTYSTISTSMCSVSTGDRAPMAAFQSLLGFASQHEPTTYNMLYDGERTG